MSSTAEINPTPFFSVEKSVALYEQQKLLYGPEVAKKQAAQIIAGDFRSIGWEATKTTDAYEFHYLIISAGTDVKLVHESDQCTGLDGKAKDLIEGFKNGAELIRRGAEYQAALAYRQALIKAPVGSTIIWGSPKQESWEGSELDFYTQSQINIAEKLSDDDIHVRQFQSEHLDTSKTVAVLNQLSGYEVLKQESNLDKVLCSLGLKSGHIENKDVQAVVDQIVGRKVMDNSPELNDLQSQICRLSEVNSRKLVEAIENGVRGESLKNYHYDLLSETLDHPHANSIKQSSGGVFLTSCGRIGLSSKSIVNTQVKWEYSFGECINCEDKNTQVGPCNICQKCEKVL